MKATVKPEFNHPALATIMQPGETVEIEVIRETHRRVITQRREYWTRKDNKGNDYRGSTMHDDLVREKGDYVGYRIHTAAGTYSDMEIYNAIGNYSLDKIFDKAA